MATAWRCASVSLSADGTIVAVGGDGVIRIFQYNGDEEWVQLGQDVSGLLVALSGNGTAFAKGGGILARWYKYNHVTGQWTHQVLDETRNYLDKIVSISGDGTKVVTGYLNPQEWLSSGVRIFYCPTDNGKCSQKGHLSTQDPDAANSIAILADGTKVALMGEDRDSNLHVQVYAVEHDDWL